MPLRAEGIELELLADLLGGEGALDVLLVGENEQRRAGEPLRRARASARQQSGVRGEQRGGGGGAACAHLLLEQRF